MELTREIFYRKPLTEVQLLEFADEAGALQGKIDREKEEIKEYCRNRRIQLKEWQDRLTEICCYLRDKRGEMEQVKVREVYDDPEPGKKSLYDAESGELYEVDDMTEEDRNSLFAQGGAAEPDPARDPEPAVGPGDTPETAIELEECEDSAVDDDGGATIETGKFYRYKNRIYRTTEPEVPYNPCKGCAFDDDKVKCPRCHCDVNELILVPDDLSDADPAAAPEPDPEPDPEPAVGPGDTPETAIEIDYKPAKIVKVKDGKFYRYDGELLQAKKSEENDSCNRCTFRKSPYRCAQFDCGDNELIKVNQESAADSAPEPDPAPPDPEPAVGPGDTPETAIEIGYDSDEKLILEEGKFYKYDGKLLRAKPTAKNTCGECIFKEESTCPDFNCDQNNVMLVQVGVLESSDDAPELPLEEASAAEVGTDPETPVRICSHCGAVRAEIRVYKMPNGRHHCENCLAEKRLKGLAKLNEKWEALKRAKKEPLIFRTMPVWSNGANPELVEFKFATGKDGAWENPIYFPGGPDDEQTEAGKYREMLLAAGAREG